MSHQAIPDFVWLIGSLGLNVSTVIRALTCSPDISTNRSALNNISTPTIPHATCRSPRILGSLTLGAYCLRIEPSLLAAGQHRSWRRSFGPGTGSIGDSPRGVQDMTEANAGLAMVDTGMKQFNAEATLYQWITTGV